MTAEQEFCYRCNAVTTWSPVRGGARLRCEGCGDVFPCKHACEHRDCADARKMHSDERAERRR